MSNSAPLIKFKNKSKCLEIVKRYNIFNQKVTDDSDIDLSTYLKFIIEHAEKKDYNYLLENQDNFKLIKILLEYTKYYSASSYIYENNTESDSENLSTFLDVLEEEFKNEDNRNENILTILVHPYLYGISYLNLNKVEYLQRYSRAVKSILPNIIKNENVIVKKSKRIKVGVVGFTINCDDKPLFVIHSVYRDRSAILNNLDPNIFEKYFIVLKQHEEEFIKKSEFGFRLKELYNNFDKIVSINAYALNVVGELMNLNLDILIYPDIGMNPFTNALGMYRIAPVQINTWGHSVTSGLDNIDYYVSSKYFELPDLEKAQEFYSEKLIAQDSLSTYYNHYNIETFLTKSQLNLPEDRQILFCIQNVKKFNLEFFTMLKRLIQKIPNILILLKKDFLKNEKMEFVRNYIGENPNLTNIYFIDYCDTYKYHCYIHHSTLVLDTYPFGGCNSSLEAFSLNKIVITRPSNFLYGRFTYGFYKKMDIMDAIVNDWEEYYDKIIFYIENPIERTKLENKIKDKKNLVFQDKDSIFEWEDMLIKLHQKHNDVNFSVKKYDTSQKLIQNGLNGIVIQHGIYVKPEELLNSNRIDIVFKYIYLKFSMKYKSFDNWSLDLYKQHVALLNGGLDGPNEFSNINKTSINDFVKMYKYLINGFIKNEFREEPLNVVFFDNIINLLKGAHRVACCLHFKKEVPIKHRSGNLFICRPEYFENREQNNQFLPIPGNEVIKKIDDDFLDFCMYEFIKLKNDSVRIVCSVSNIESQNDSSQAIQLNKLLSNYGIYIAFYKKVILTNKGIHNLQSEHFFLHELDNKLDEYVLNIFILESDCETIKYVDDFETNITKRELVNQVFTNSLEFGVSKQNENQLNLAQVFFNKNTLDFYNNYNIMFTLTMSKLFEQYTSEINTIKDNHIESDEANLDFCLSGNFVLSLCKPKKIRSLEYIHNRCELSNDLFDHQNDFGELFPEKIKDIIYNPKNHFFIRGVKCCKLSIVKEMITKI